MDGNFAHVRSLRRFPFWRRSQTYLTSAGGCRPSPDSRNRTLSPLRNVLEQRQVYPPFLLISPFPCPAFWWPEKGRPSLVARPWYGSLALLWGRSWSSCASGRGPGAIPRPWNLCKQPIFIPSWPFQKKQGEGINLRREPPKWCRGECPGTWPSRCPPRWISVRPVIKIKFKPRCWFVVSPQLT